MTGHPADQMMQLHPHLRRVLARSNNAAKVAARKRRAYLARVLTGLAVTVLLGAASALTWLLDTRDNRIYRPLGIPLFSWFLAGALLMPVMLLASFAVWGTISALDAALSSAFENVNYVLLGVRRGLQCASSHLRSSQKFCLALQTMRSKCAVATLYMGR